MATERRDKTMNDLDMWADELDFDTRLAWLAMELEDMEIEEEES